MGALAVVFGHRQSGSDRSKPGPLYGAVTWEPGGPVIWGKRLAPGTSVMILGSIPEGHPAFHREACWVWVFGEERVWSVFKEDFTVLKYIDGTVPERWKGGFDD